MVGPLRCVNTKLDSPQILGLAADSYIAMLAVTGSYENFRQALMVDSTSGRTTPHPSHRGPRRSIFPNGRIVFTAKEYVADRDSANRESSPP